MTKVCILGATGSIGKQTLDVCRNAGFEVTAVAAHSNHEELYHICNEYKPGYAALYDKKASDAFASYGGAVKTFSGMDGVLEIIRKSRADIVVNGIVGSAGILPTIEALRCADRVALANKETLVAAGELVMAAAKKHNCEIIPVDSEHSAVFQCLKGNQPKQASGIILTASGGPFRGYSKQELESVTIEMALRHPNWVMGNKITIDSATLMNKGLEVIEAKWLFGMDYDNIKVVIHPQSIIHSMVEYIDNSIIAQMGAPDMRVPIQYALTYPDRVINSFSKMNIYDIGTLDFEEPDEETFRCLSLAYEAGRTGGTMPCAMNAANEEAVKMFLAGKISFSGIPDIIENVMEGHSAGDAGSIESIMECDRAARKAALNGGKY